MPIFDCSRRDAFSTTCIAYIAAAALLPLTTIAQNQTVSCPSAPSHAATPADTAYINGDYAGAEQLYSQALVQQPNDPALSAALVRTLLHESKVTQASLVANAAAKNQPTSAPALTALAEVQLRAGEPWQALQTLDSATASDRCFANAYLVRSRILRLDSMYASERAELKKAHDIDPTDPDIATAWSRIVSPAQEIDGIAQSLTAMKDLDTDTRQKAEATMQSLLPLLTENSQTCKVAPSGPSATLPLLPSKQDGKNIDGFRIAVQLPKTGAKLGIDSATSGIFITRALAEENGLQQGAGDPAGTVHADSLHIGPLEFHDCMLGVSDAPFAGKADGFIGTDIFSPFLITIDWRAEKLTLDPLPAVPGVIPGDRPSAPELAGFMPVYHRRHYLLVPVTLNNKSRKLFVLDTGMRLSTMGPDAAHAISNIKVNFTNPMQTASGPPAQVYRDNFDFQFANLSLTHQNHIVEFDPSAIERNLGFDIAGLLGFDILRQLTMHIDYRDGLVKFESTNPDIVAPEKENMTASAPSTQPSEAAAAACQINDGADRPLNTTVEAKVSGGLDSAHLKPGKEIWLKLAQGYAFPECTLDADAIVYGHVVTVSSTKKPDSSELSLAFDHGDCRGRGKREMTLRLIGLVAAPDEHDSLHGAVPTRVAGGGRDISITAADTNGYDANLNPGGPPKTIHPGIVVGMPTLKLEPEGGPACSARISSTHRSVELGPGVELILGMYGSVK